LGPGTTINLNALTCYGLVSSEVSHLIATLVKRYVVHTDNTDLHIPVTRLASKQQGSHRTAAAHVPYTVLLTPGGALTSLI